MGTVVLYQGALSPLAMRRSRQLGLIVQIMLWGAILLALWAAHTGATRDQSALVRYDSTVAGTSVKVNCPNDWAAWLKARHFWLGPKVQVYGMVFKPQHHIYLSPQACNLNTALGVLTNTHESMHVRHPLYAEGAVEACTIDYLRAHHRLTQAILRIHRSLLWYYQIGSCVPGNIWTSPHHP